MNTTFAGSCPKRKKDAETAFDGKARLRGSVIDIGA
jgi:hypothetical protein